MASAKRCHYDVLGLSRDCTADEIRSAYKKLALQRHPDKLMQSGLSQSDATAQFQELSHAYEILSDPKERSWYDSHRSQILFSDSKSSNSSSLPNLYSYFSNTVFSGYSDSAKGFYKVYSDLFNKIYSNELNFSTKLGLGSEAVRQAPIMGNLDSPYAQVTSFYGYWLGFSTVMDFGWVDEYDAMAGMNRKSRRVMEEENKKLRKKARREYNETVRGLAEFVKKRDKRVVDMMVKKNLENERKRAEERERRNKLEKEKLERARAYEEPQWAKVEEDDIGVEEDEEFETSEAEELYCVACRKKFKSEKQWKNHEQSKKHKEKVAQLRDSFAQFDQFDEEKEERTEVEHCEETRDGDNVEELGESFRNSVGIEDENESSEDEENVDYGNVKRVGDSIGSDFDDDEIGVLESMVSGHKSRRNATSRHEANESSFKIRAEDDSGEDDFMEYDNRRSSKNKRRGIREKSKCKTADKEASRQDLPEVDLQNVESNGHDNKPMEESSSHEFGENESNDKGDDQLAKSHKKSNQALDKKGNKNKEPDPKSKNSLKGRKGKATSKNSSTVCETCGEDFESRNRLHKHLGDTGHAKLKHR